MDDVVNSSDLLLEPKPSSLEILDHDILTLIVEQLYLDLTTIPRTSWSPNLLKPLRQLRYVSFRLYKAARPFRSRIIFVDSLIADRSRCQLWKYIRECTRHVVFRTQDFNWRAAATLLEKCSHIKSIEWSCWPEYPKGLFHPIPKLIGCVIQERWPTAELYIVGFPWQIGPMGADSITTSFPCTNIVSISNSGSADDSYHRATSWAFRCLVAAAPKLRYLELRFMRNVFSAEGPRFPPIKHLKLLRCMWHHQIESVENIWNFSQLERLELDDVSGVQFFPSLARNALPCLKSLEVTQPFRFYQEGGLVRELHHFISKATDMRSIDVVCNFRVLDIPSLMEQWQELRVLKVHDHIGFGESNGDILCPTLDPAGFSRLQECCPNLQHLSLDIDSQVCDEREIMSIIAKFKSLTKLGLQLRTTLTERGDNGDGDPDLEHTRELVDHLTSRKRGRPMEVVTLYIYGFGLFKDASYTNGWADQERKGHSRKRQFTVSWTGERRRRIFIQTPLSTGWREDRTEDLDDLILRLSVASESVCDQSVGPW